MGIANFSFLLYMLNKLVESYTKKFKKYILLLKKCIIIHFPKFAKKLNLEPIKKTLPNWKNLKIQLLRLVKDLKKIEQKLAS